MGYKSIALWLERINARIVKLVNVPQEEILQHLNVIVSDDTYDSVIWKMPRFNEQKLKEFLINARAILIISPKRKILVSKIFQTIEKMRMRHEKEVNILYETEREIVLEILTTYPQIDPVDFIMI